MMTKDKAPFHAIEILDNVNVSELRPAGGLLKIEVSDNPIPTLSTLSLDENAYSVDYPVAEVDSTEGESYSKESKTCLITRKESNNIFRITANCYKAEDARQDLNLVTIEYLGNTGEPIQIPRPINNKEVKSELDSIKKLISEQYYNVGMKPRPSTITVQEWIEKKFEENKQYQLLLQKTESTERNWHARIKIVEGESGPSIIKHFDVSASNLGLEEITAMYLEYRKRISEVYSIPKLEKLKILSTSEFEVTEPFVVGKSGQEIVTNGNFSEICRFLSGVMLPLARTIESPRKLPEGQESPYPVKYPVDWKPENFIETIDGKIFNIDLFPPMLRASDGSVITLYPKTDKPVRFAMNYGEYHILTARMLSRCVRIRPELAIEMTKFTKNIIKKIDRTGKMLELLHIFANSQERIKIYGSKPGGIEMFKELSRNHTN